MNSIKTVLAFGVCALVLGAAQARADALEDEYLKARSAYVARFDPGEKEVDYKKIEAPLKRAYADLQNKLRRILGKPGIVGAKGEGKLNEFSLLKGDQEFGALDALVYPLDGKGNENAHAYVTTSTLLVAWLKDHRDWWDKGSENVPQQAEAALKFDGFYTQAISTDAAVVKFADLDVKAPAGASVRAMLDRRQQDDAPGAPDEIIVGAVHSGRVYIVTAPAVPKPPVITACENVWKDFETKSNEVYEKYRASDLKDEASMTQSETLRRDGDKAFRACYAEKVKALPVYAKLVERAQGLVERITGK